MKTPLLIIFTFLSLNSFSQLPEPVSFTDQSDLLSTIFAFSYNDCAVDMNGDHLDDVVRVTQNALYIDFQQPDGSFQQGEFPVNFQNEPDWSICAGDLDGNGFNDLLFGGGDAVSFVLANADGTAYTETEMPGFIFSQRSTMADIDNDGDLDAFVCHDIDQSHPYRNDGDGNMSLDQSLIVTADRPGNYTAIWTDYDNDGDIDLYITKCKGGSFPGDIDRTNLLYRNNGDGSFSEVGEEAGVADNAQSWSTVFEDFDNDGDFDAFVVNHDFKNRFYLNNGDGTFTDIIDDTGIAAFDLGAWENAAGDFNNDGFVDIFSELNNEFYLNNGDLTFSGQSANITPGGIGDFNNDGFLDVINNSTLMINEGNDNNWLKINPVGIQSNRNGIGARVEIFGDWGVQVREVRAGQSFSPMSSLQVHFGLGEHTEIDQVIVKWPSGIVTTVDSVGINTTVTIHEAGCLLPPSMLTVSGATELCTGDSVLLSAPSGYSYAWTNGDTTQSITATQAGSYQATLIDSTGCLSLSNAVIVSLIQETPPVISLDGEEKFCEGGSVTLVSSPGENYLWSNNMTGQSIDVMESGFYTVSVDAQCSQDPLVSAPVEITVFDADPPDVSDITIGVGDSILLTANGDNPYWFDAAFGGSLLATGNTYQTPPLDQPVTYYVEDHVGYPGELQSGGKPDNTGPGGVPNQGAYSFFDAWEPFTIRSVKVYVPAEAPSGQRTIELRNDLDELLDQLIVNLQSPGEYVIDLDFEVPAGNGFSLRCAQNNLFRNSGGVSYPYPIGDAGELTNSFFGNSFYYYFYDWTIQKAGLECISERVPVTVSVSAAEEEFLAAGFSVFPNPANSELAVEFSINASSVRLINPSGKVVLHRPVSGNGSLKLDLSGLSAGLYVLQIESDRKVYHYRIAKF